MQSLLVLLVPYTMPNLNTKRRKMQKRDSFFLRFLHILQNYYSLKKMESLESFKVFKGPKTLFFLKKYCTVLNRTQYMPWFVSWRYYKDNYCVLLYLYCIELVYFTEYFYSPFFSFLNFNIININEERETKQKTDAENNLSCSHIAYWKIIHSVFTIIWKRN